MVALIGLTFYSLYICSEKEVKFYCVSREVINKKVNFDEQLIEFNS